MKVVKKCLKFGPSESASTVSSPSAPACFDENNLAFTANDSSSMEVNNNSIKSVHDTSSTNTLSTNNSVDSIGVPIGSINTNSMPAFGSNKWVTVEPKSWSPGKYGGFLGAVRQSLHFPSFKIGEKETPTKQSKNGERTRKPVETFRKGDLPTVSEMTLDKEVPRNCMDTSDVAMEVEGCVPLDSLEQGSEEHLKLVAKSHDNSLDCSNLVSPSSSMETEVGTPKTSSWYKRVFEAGKTLRSWLGSLSPRTKNRKDVQLFREQLVEGTCLSGEGEKSPPGGQESNYSTLRGLLKNPINKVLW